LQAYAQAGQGAHIGVAKHIPVQAGMGGGSSDAATCLLALNRLWDLKLPLASLEQIGLGLGADVPFFLRGHNAWVEGIGEQITPIALRPAQLCVVKPAPGLDTREIFAATDLERTTAPAIIAGFAAHHGTQTMHGPQAYAFGRNDLQPVAQRLCPAVTQAIEWLGAHGMHGRMTGSGSAVFAVMPQNAPPVVPSALPQGWQVRQCSNMAVHPLAGWTSSDIS
jgi:4-diphosphocytidyl-2-C-methyl-D-erythritol kinase